MTLSVDLALLKIHGKYTVPRGICGPSAPGTCTCGAGRLRETGAPAGGYMWAFRTWHMYLWGRPAEGNWGSSRRLFVGHLCLAFVSVICDCAVIQDAEKKDAERRRKKADLT